MADARGDRRRDRRVRAVRRPADAAARGRRPHVRGGRLRRGRAGPPPGPDRLRLLRHPRRRGRGRGRRRRSARTLGRGDFFGEVSILLGEPPIADVVALAPAALPRPRRPRGRAVPRRPPAGHVPDAPGPGPPAARTRTDGGAEPTGAPFPPGDYPVVVVGSGPGGAPGLVLAAAARASTTRSSRPTRRPAACSGAGRSSSGCCRGPSRTRPSPRGTRAYERYDWNSLLADEPEPRGDPARAHGRHVVLPVAPRDGGEPRGVRRAGRRRASATAAAGRATRREETADGDALRRSRRPTASTAAGSLVLAVGVAEPYTPAGARASSTPTTTPTSGRPRRTPAGGSSSSASRTPGSSSRPGCCRGRARSSLALAVAGQAVGRDAVAGRRPGALRPAVRGPRPRRRRRHPRRRDRPASSARATGALTVRPPTRPTAASRPGRRGRRGHRRDRVRLPAAATCRTSASRRSAQSRLPAQTPWWESATVPGIFFAGTIGQGVARASRSTASRRTPARSTAPATTPGSSPAHIAETRFGIVDRAAARSTPRDLVDYLLARGDPRARAVAPEGVPRPGRLARPGRRHPRRGHPAARPRARRQTEDVIAMTVEADGTGAIYPVVYVPARRAARGARAAGPPAARLRDAGARRRAPPGRSAGGRSHGCGAGRCRRIDRPRCSRIRLISYRLALYG